MTFPLKKAVQASLLAAGALAISAVSGCFALSDGLDPPADQLYYPTAIVTSPGGSALYVINSDFDIQYTGGTVQAIDLDGVRACVGRLARGLAKGSSAENTCQDIGLPLNDNPILVPGPCGPIDLAGPTACTLTDDSETPEKEGAVAGPLIKASHAIGAFASSATLARNPSAAGDEASARLFVAVRGDPSITYFNTTDDARNPSGKAFLLDCFASGDGAASGDTCASASRIGTNLQDSTRAPLPLPIEPVGITATEDGRAIVTVHEAQNAVSLTVNSSWAYNDRPTVEFVTGLLPGTPSDVAAVPVPAYIQTLQDGGQAVDYRPGFLVTMRGAREVDMLRFFDDEASTIQRHFLQSVARFTIATNIDGSDSRGIAVDASERKACEAACSGDVPCLRGCTDIPLQVFVANRAPASLLIGKLETQLVEKDGEVTSAFDLVNLNDMIPLTTGPSRVAVGDVLDKDGRRARRVFAVSFDSRYVAIYNPLERRIEAAVRTGRGPHALAIDVAEATSTSEGHAFLYVAHFTDSYIGAVDLDTRHARTYGSMIAAVGKPTPPKESN